MRKLWVAALALLSTLAFLIVGSPPASAFGSEVLGCSFDSAPWTANSCDGGGDGAYHTVTFSAHNLSGTYTTSWAIYFGGNLISNTCSGTTCAITVKSNPIIGRDHGYGVYLTLNQSGQTRTVSASAMVYGGPDCIRC